MKVQTEDLEEQFLLHEFNICRLLHSTDCLPVYGVPKVFEYKSEPEYNFLVMQYTGMSLDDASKSVGGLPLKTTFTLGIELLKVLDRLHSNNVFHLDVCSQNVKVQHEYGEDGEDMYQIYLADFAFSLHINDAGTEVAGNRINVPAVEHSETMPRSQYLMELRRACRIRDCVGVLTTMMNAMISPGNVLCFSDSVSLHLIDLNRPSSREMFSQFPLHFLQFLEHLRSLPDDMFPDTASLQNIFRTGLHECE